MPSSWGGGRGVPRGDTQPSPHVHGDSHAGTVAAQGQPPRPSPRRCVTHGGRWRPLCRAEGAGVAPGSEVALSAEGSVPPFPSLHPSAVPLLWPFAPGGLSPAVPRHGQAVVTATPRNGSSAITVPGHCPVPRGSAGSPAAWAQGSGSAGTRPRALRLPGSEHEAVTQRGGARTGRDTAAASSPWAPRTERAVVHGPAGRTSSSVLAEGRAGNDGHSRRARREAVLASSPRSPSLRPSLTSLEPGSGGGSHSAARLGGCRAALGVGGGAGRLPTGTNKARGAAGIVRRG